MDSPSSKTIVAEYLPTPKISDTCYQHMIMLKVEDVIFRLPRFAFEERFKEELSRSEGLGDLNPITLEGISIDEFNVFLHVLYLGPSTMFDKKLELTKEEWMMALRVSCVLKFKSVNKLATKYLPDVDPITRLSFYKEYDVVDEEWVREALLQLVQRESPLSEEEAKCLGMRVAYISWGHYR
ncbi:hypothetical protein PNOK_0482900 [Pyrrhoderma noxium]|uniref:BTB domain-containing protein n=1 Tax=Pyrrhoderma noxium TaxID=2282107 RepID=A0A286UK97_9AGAM|nr:hypothetical protein PNOK_0482900 [Pyrrhoderma noxium]